MYEAILGAESGTTFEPAKRQEVLATLRRRLADIDTTDTTRTARATDQEGQRGVLPVAPELATLLPGGGLPRGATVSLVGSDVGADVGGGGVTSLLFALLASPAAGWGAVVGLPGLGLLAAAELGVDLAKLVVIPDPGEDVVQVLTLLADGVDLIAVAAPSAPLASGRLRVLQGRLRQRGAVLLVAGPWQGADLVLRAGITGWSGIGTGHGRLRDRDLFVAVAGRRLAGRRREATLALRASRQAVVLHRVQDGDAGAESTMVGHPVGDEFPMVGQSVGTRRKVGA